MGTACTALLKPHSVFPTRYPLSRVFDRFAASHLEAVVMNGMVDPAQFS